MNSKVGALAPAKLGKGGDWYVGSDAGPIDCWRRRA